MNQFEGPDYFVIKSVDGTVYCLEPGHGIVVNGDIEGEQMRRYTEVLFKEPIGRLYDKDVKYNKYYTIPISKYLYKVKEEDCRYELIGLSSDSLTRTYWHFLKKKTKNIEID